jgi:hypothetical protein
VEGIQRLNELATAEATIRLSARVSYPAGASRVAPPFSKL